MSKTKIKSIIKKIMEQIDYGDYPERMDPNTERKLGDPEQNLYGTNPAMPRGSLDVQKIASERFKEVVDKLREAIGQPNLTSNVVQTIIYNEFMSSTIAAKNIERRYKDRLEQLAIKSAFEASEVNEENYIVRATLTDAPGMISSEEFKTKPKHRQPISQTNLYQEPGSEEERMKVRFDDEEYFQLEVHKRNIINGIIQGSAKRGHYIFQKPSVKRELDDMDPNLYDHYLKIMAINDYFYFTMERLIETMSNTGTGIEGKENISSVKTNVPSGNEDDDDEDENNDNNVNQEIPQNDTNKFQITATGLLFPILCHEIIKGIEETLGKFGYGYPENSERAKEVLGQTDTLPNEAMSLRIGPGLVRRIRVLLPDEMFAEENFGIKPFFYVLLYQIPAPQFLSLMRDVISEDERENTRARNKFREIFEKALRKKERYEHKRQGPQEPINLPKNVEKPIDTPITEPKPESTSKDIDNATLAGMGLNALNFELNKAIDDQNWDLAMKIQRMIDRKQR